DELDTEGLKGYDEAAFNTNMALSESEWKAELESQTELFNMVGDKLPAELEAQRQSMLAKFN
ncbi:MAG: phosphoenolpyruvate carboxykinase (GTP), partial [Akkermansia sp.]|nr:phosphoenolpyruvate carboxykinase (GTP) [Akkermansia sp.]